MYWFAKYTVVNVVVKWQKIQIIVFKDWEDASNKQNFWKHLVIALEDYKEVMSDYQRMRESCRDIRPTIDLLGFGIRILLFPQNRLQSYTTACQK